MPSAAAVKEFTQYVTKGLTDNKQEQRQHVILSSYLTLVN